MISIDEVLTRGVAEIFPSKKALQELMEKKKITVYLGIDPSRPALHIGTGLVLKKLKHFQDLGHKIILLVGDFTAMMGDPSDKTTARPKLSRKQVIENAKFYKKQAEIFIKFEGKNPAKLLFNSEWLNKLSFEDGLNLMSHFTIQQLLEREMFQKRLKEAKPLFAHEIVYPIMQAYDSVSMDVDLEIGGTDQTFNMLTGRILMKTLKGKEKFVLTHKLLSGTDGEKMSKSLDNYIPMLATSQDMYAKLMALHDKMIPEYLELATDFSLEDINKMLNSIKNGENPMLIKKKIAFDITRQYHGQQKAEEAEREFEKTFQKQKPAYKLKIPLKESLAATIAPFTAGRSISAAKRIINQGGVDLNGQRAKITTKVKIGDQIKIGKKVFGTVV